MLVNSIRRHTMARQPVGERLMTAEAQALRGARAVAVGLGKRALEVVTRHLSEDGGKGEPRTQGPGEHVRPPDAWILDQRVAHVFGGQRISGRPQRGPPQRVLKLANVPRPGVGGEDGEGAGHEFLRRVPRIARVLGVDVGEQALDEDGEIAWPVPQRRHLQDRDGQAIEQVRAKAAGGDVGEQIA
ncbi:MAG TPA: hypothetical protein VKE22_03160, partial [Haliangiales bacterium]|nr:hypothetical protein [Haliangiales bacterium]